jgi:hypothetical protein
MKARWTTEMGTVRAIGLVSVSAAVALAALLVPGCGSEDVTEPDDLVGISVSPDTLAFAFLNDSAQLTVIGTFTQSGNVNLTTSPITAYASRDEDVVTVSASGLVTAEGNGDAYVVVTHGAYSDSALAVVSAAVLTGLAVTPETVVLPAIGARLQLTVTGTTSGGPIDLTSNPQTGYVSRNQAIAGVSPGGEVNAVAAGQAYIVATNGGFSDSALVDVDPASSLAVDSLTIAPASVNFVVLGDETATTSTIFWENGARRDGPGSPILYSTDDALVAEVNANGVVVAIGEGSTSVHASLGGQIATASVTVAHQYSFATEILPIFTGPNVPPTPTITNCVGSGCHVSAGGSPGNGLRLDSYATLDAGGINGPVVVPGDPSVSRIIRALRGTLEFVGRMPKGRSALPDTTIAKIEDWIDQGALDN